jgi:hypothetical protein
MVNRRREPGSSLSAGFDAVAAASDAQDARMALFGHRYRLVRHDVAGMFVDEPGSNIAFRSIGLVDHRVVLPFFPLPLCNPARFTDLNEAELSPDELASVAGRAVMPHRQLTVTYITIRGGEPALRWRRSPASDGRKSPKGEGWPRSSCLPSQLTQAGGSSASGQSLSITSAMVTAWKLRSRHLGHPSTQMFLSLFGASST